MKNKLVKTMLCICLISLLSVSVVAGSVEARPNLLSKLVKVNSEKETKYLYITMGPTSDDITDMEFINGNFRVIQKLDRYMYNSPLVKILPIKVNDLSFIVEYKLDIESNNSVYNYFTLYAGLDENSDNSEFDPIQITNEKHTVKVENFEGYFLFLKGGVKSEDGKIHVPYFMIVGTADNIEEI